MFIIVRLKIFCRLSIAASIVSLLHPPISTLSQRTHNDDTAAVTNRIMTTMTAPTIVRLLVIPLSHRLALALVSA